jgi:hypothetical protein
MVFNSETSNFFWLNMRSGLFSSSENPKGIQSHSPGLRRGVAADATLGPMLYISANPKGLRPVREKTAPTVADATPWVIPFLSIIPG